MSILQALNATKASQFSRMMQAMRGNPQALLSQLSQNNPNMQRVNQLIQQNGGDARKAFYSLANQMGVNPDDVLSMLK